MADEMVPSGDKPKRGLPRPVRLILIGLVGAVLLIVLGFAGAVLREYWRPIPAPSFQHDLSRLLGAENPRTSETAKLKGPGGVVAGVTSSTLRFAEFFPNPPEKPAEIRTRRTEFNRRFDGIFGRVADYEGRKNQLGFDEADAILKQILEDWRKVWTDAHKMRPDILLDQSDKTVGERSMAFMDWCWEAQIDNAARHEKWIEAKGKAIELLYLKWREGNFPEFNHATNYEDYNRVLYYCQRQRGIKGVLAVGSWYLYRVEEDLSAKWKGKRT